MDSLSHMIGSKELGMPKLTARAGMQKETKRAAANSYDRGKSTSPTLGPDWRISPDGGKTEIAATVVATKDLGDEWLVLVRISQ